MAKSVSASAKDTREKWLKRIKDEESAHKDWRDPADAADAAYFLDYHKNADKTRTIPESYPLFPSTIKVIHGRVFSQPPKPDVRKRYTDDAVGGAANQNTGGMAGAAVPMGAGSSGGTPVPSGPPAGPPAAPRQPGPLPNGAGAPVGQTAAGPPQPPPLTVDDNKMAQLIERALGYVIDTTRFDGNGHMSVNDFLITALGIAKVEMETVTEMQPVTNPVTGQPIMVHKETGEPAPIDEQGQPVLMEGMDPNDYAPAQQEVIVDQITTLRHFSFKQYHWEPMQHWSQVTWEAFDHYMTKQQIESKFKVTLSSDGPTKEGSESSVVGGDPKKPQSAKYKDQFCVHEIWDKKAKERLFICEDYDGVLDQEDDPLGLKDFFPNPEPMFLNLRGDDLLPMPDYCYCQMLFEQCNELSNRIGKVIQQIREMGFYDASVPELQQLKGGLPPDGTMIPIAGLAQRIAQAGGKADGTLNSVVARWDNQTSVAVIQELLNLIEVFKSRIWEIYGIPDILRGSTNPNETFGAQQLKAQWADVRIGEKVRIVALFFRDIFRIMAEIIAERFQPDILEKMTGITLNEREIQVLRSDYGRCYAIDVESDSTVAQDEFANQQQVMDFMNAMSGMIEKVLPAVQQGMMPADLGKEMLLKVASAFKQGRQLEQAIQNLPGTAQQLAGMNQQIATLQQQLKGANDMVSGLQKQLQGVNMGKEQRENAKTVSDVQAKQVSNQKTMADTEHTQVLTAAEAQHIHESANQNHPATSNVVPMAPRPA